MSEDPPAAEAPPPEAPVADAPATDRAKLSDAAESAPPATGSGTAVRSRRGVRIAVLAGVAVLVIVGAVLVAKGRHRAATAVVADDKHDGGGAAIRAPEGPGLPGLPATGVRLTGFVIDGAGLPVAGAEVSAELEKGAADRALAPVPRGLDAGVSTPVDAAAADAAGTSIKATVLVATPTGIDGRFVVEGLDPGRYRVRVIGAGLLPAEVRYVPVPSDATRIIVSRQVGIEGVVTDGGKPAANVNVAVRGDAIGGQLDQKTDAAGKFTFGNLPEGRFQLFAWQGSLAARAVRVSRLGAGPFAPVELRLEAAAIVIGRVIDRDEGTGLVAAIELRPSGDDQAPRYARSGDDGVFKIEGVPNGKWIADAFTPGYLSPGGVEIEAGQGIPELALSRGATVEGKVVDADGKPIAGATVRALTGGANPVETSAAVDQDKLRRFSGRMAAPLAVGPGTTTTDPQFIARGELGVTVGPIPPLPPPGAQTAVSAVVDPIAVGMAGEPPPLAVEPSHAAVWTTGTDGVYRIRGLARGKLSVLAVATGYAEGRSKDLTLDAGQTLTKVDIVLSPGTFVLGKVSDQHGVPVIGAQVTLRPEVGAPMDAFTDEDGAYRLGPVSGKVELHASAYGHGDANRALELPPVKGATAAEQKEDLVLVLADAVLAGTLDDTSGAPVAAATIEVIGGSADGRHAVVGTDGTFSLDQLPVGPLKIRIRHPDYPTRDLDVVASDGKQRVRLRLPLGGAIEGAVIEASSGAPLTSIVVGATGPAGTTAEATTDKVGRFKLGPLDPGAWKLALKLPGYLPTTRSVDVTAARTPGGTTVRDVRIELARGALVGGTVRDARGQRVVGATVTVRAAGGATVEGTTDAAGEFRLRDCPTGEVEVSAAKDELRGATRATVRAGDEVLGLSIDVR
ncbi:MAG: carboxypeptidase regulatory-like domain-containing protein [Myxococcales bacterium]|nr:carboxypeptidase regulatory-like domain-containing protein [Myxococcales bacterium]